MQKINLCELSLDNLYWKVKRCLSKLYYLTLQHFVSFNFCRKIRSASRFSIPSKNCLKYCNDSVAKGYVSVLRTVSSSKSLLSLAFPCLWVYCFHDHILSEKYTQSESTLSYSLLFKTSLNCSMFFHCNHTENDKSSSSKSIPPIHVFWNNCW